MTLGEMIDRVLALVGADTARLKDFSREEIGRYLNDTYRQIVLETSALENQFWFQVTEGTATYQLPVNMGKIQRIAHRDRRIAPVSVFDLDRINAQWEDETGEIDAYTVFERNAGVVRTYRNPDYDNALVLDMGYGTVVEATDEDDNAITDWHFRFQSLEVSLGVVTDFEETDETVTFAAAASGGGSDADYGLVVAITDSASTGRFELSGDLGVLVNLEDETDTDFDSVAFFGATENTQTMELGVVLDVEAEDSEYVFNSQEGVNFPAPTSELGTEVWWKNDDEILEVWADETPIHMAAETDSPRLPAWTHMGLVYGACSKALTKTAPSSDEFVASSYAVMYLAWKKFLKERAINSTKETSRGFGQAVNGARRVRRGPRLPGEYPRV